MGKNLDNDRGVFDGGDMCQPAPTLEAVGHVDYEHAFEQLGPAQAGWGGSRGSLALGITASRRLVGRGRDNLGPEGGIGREHSMETNEMEPRPRNQGRQPLQEFQGSHHDMGGAIAIRRFQLKNNLTGGRAAQSFVTMSWTRDIPTEALVLWFTENGH